MMGEGYPTWVSYLGTNNRSLHDSYRNCSPFSHNRNLWRHSMHGPSAVTVPRAYPPKPCGAGLEPVRVPTWSVEQALNASSSARSTTAASLSANLLFPKLCMSRFSLRGSAGCYTAPDEHGAVGLRQHRIRTRIASIPFASRR